MRYFIEVKAWKHVTPSNKISKRIHLYVEGMEALCGSNALFGRGGPVAKANCPDCLAILEKQGRAE